MLRVDAACSPTALRALALAEKVLAAVRADRLVANHLDAQLKVGTLRLPSPGGRLLIHGAGKASAAMAQGALSVLGDRVDGGLVITKEAAELPFEVFVSSHPHLTERSVEAGEKMLAAARQCGPDDLVLFMLSGGASALMESPKPGVSLEALKASYRDWLLSGIPIHEMNARRSEVSALKAGGLATAYGQVQVVVMVLSDVQGNDLQVIGSGPLSVGPDARPHVFIGDAWTAARAIEGEIEIHPEFITEPDQILSKIKEGRSFAAVGEPTFPIHPNSPPGGRAQHLALLAAPLLPPGSAFLALGTDGTDGPTPFAGALAEPVTAGQCVEAIAGFDATRFWEERGRTLTTGPTGLNVNDLYLFITP